MIVRSAVLEGTVAEADRAAFDALARGSILPAITRYPGIREVRLRKPAETEAGAPPVYMIFDLYFDDLAAMLDRLKAAGVPLLDEEPRRGAEGALVAFVHPRGTGGILLELTQPQATPASPGSS